MKNLDTKATKRQGVLPLGSLLTAVFSLVLCSAMTACVSSNDTGIYFASGEGATTSDGLHRTRWAPFESTYIRPGVRMEDYKKVVIEPLTIAYKDDPNPKRIGGQAFGTYEPLDPNYPITDSARQEMENFYLDCLKAQLVESGRFEEVSLGAAEKSQEAVLLIRGYIPDLVISVAPLVDQPPDGTQVVNDSGQMTLMLDIFDVSTGQALVRMADSRQIRSQHDYYVSEGIAQSGALRLIFGQWAGGVRREIDQLSALGEIPAPEG